jgi:hypothetical protein
MSFRLGAISLLTCVLSAHDAHSVGPMVAAARNFIASLDEAQRAKALFRFEDDERYWFHYVPSDDIPKTYKRPRLGLTLREMAPHQKHLVSALLSASLSQQGYGKATTIMSLEDILRVLERDSGERRNPERYHLSLFGEPGEKGPWGLRFEGHHVSLHFTVVDGKVTGDPMFLGSNPAEVRSGPRAGLRVLGEEEDRARALLLSLTPPQRQRAIIGDKAFSDILTTTKRKAMLEGAPAGLKAADMTPAQRKLLSAVLEVYIRNLPDDTALVRRDRVAKAGTNLYFAWAGVAERGGPHYYRVQAETFLLEYDNTQNGANHVHSVWRDRDGDWGEDLLERHYKESPHHQEKQ